MKKRIIMGINPIGNPNYEWIDDYAKPSTAAIPLFDEILNCRSVRGICKRCGNAATHSLIYCKNCGNKFFRPAIPLQLIQAMKIVKNSTGTGGSYYKPYFQAAIHKLRIKRHGYTENDFINYVEQVLQDIIGG